MNISSLIIYWEVSHANCVVAWFINCVQHLETLITCMLQQHIFWALLRQNCYVILNFFLRFLLLNFYYFPCCKPFLNTFKKNYLKKKIRKFNFLGCRKYPLHVPDAAWQLKHFSKIKRKHFHSLEVTKFKTKKANFIVLNSLPNFWCLIYFGSI